MRVVHEQETTVGTTPATVDDLGLTGQNFWLADRAQISVSGNAYYTYSGVNPTTNSHKLTNNSTLFLESREEVENFRIRAASGTITVFATFWRERS